MNLFEAVDVDEQQAQACPDVSRGDNQIVQALIELVPVRQAGQDVVLGEVPQLRMPALRERAHEVGARGHRAVAALPGHDEPVEDVLVTTGDEQVSCRLDRRGLVERQRGGVHHVRYRPRPGIEPARVARQMLDELEAVYQPDWGILLIDDGDRVEVLIAREHLRDGVASFVGPDRRHVMRELADGGGRRHWSGRRTRKQ